LYITLSDLQGYYNDRKFILKYSVHDIIARRSAVAETDAWNSQLLSLSNYLYYIQFQTEVCCCLLADRCAFWLIRLHPAATVSEDVNRKCTSIGTRRYNFQPATPTLSATMYSVTDRQTDRRRDGSNMPLADHTV